MQLHRPPPWAKGLVESPVRRARFGATTRSLIYELSVEGGAVRIQLPSDGRTGFAWHQLRVDATAGVSPTAGAAAGLRDDSTFRADANRHAWVLARLSSTTLPNDHQPSTLDETLAGLMKSLVVADDALQLPPGAELSEPYVAGLASYFQAVNGEWQQVFAPSEPDRSDWAEPVRALFHGDVHALQVHARRTSVEGSPLANIIGTLFKDLGFVEVGVELIESSVGGLAPAERADVLLGLGRVQGRAGKLDQAQATLRRAALLAGHDPRFLRRVAAEFVRIGAVDDAYRVLEDCCEREPNCADALVEFVKVLLFAGEWDRALALLRRVEALAPERPEILRYRGAVAVERRELDPAVQLLERLIARHPDDREARTWLCEALIRQGRLEQARVHHTEARAEHDGAVHILLHGALATEGRVGRDAELSALLGELGDPVEPDQTIGEESRARILGHLGTLRGSRGEILVRVDPTRSGPTGTRMFRMTKVETRLQSRSESAAAIKSLMQRPVAEVLATFDELIERFPRSPHPFFYRGELRLWWGDYAEAMKDFEDGRERDVARWGYVGPAAVHILRGDYDAVPELIAECNRRFPPIPSASTSIYLGEMYRRQGKLELAARQLEESLRVKPGRISAWINLGLVHERAGRSREASDVFDRIHRWAPRLLWDSRAAVEASDGRVCQWPPSVSDMRVLFEAALALMRGNRSSHFVTYFDRHGRLRRVFDAGHWQQQLGRMRILLLAETRRRLVG